ncbi:hypothetical protein GHT06_005782 [Daphnia sinensis]|uniref:Uncharacterized protein n=1 Tax=Daphnia sinensis TaxID=1820382 RepID=A0AAD5KE58_9CRUS|nr:hypothetical protein GHT06_005782 [Daphnia sinensis]
MAVTSTTLAGVNVFRFSGAVTDAEIKAAWANNVSEGRYVLNRAIYLDNTADLTGVQGGFAVDFGTQVLPAIILHTSRDRSKSTFKNFIFTQRVGLIVNQRSGFVNTTNGTSLSNAGSGLSVDGLSLNGGGFVYGVAGNAGGPGDTRFLNEMAFAGTEGATIMSQEFTEEELQICVGASTVIRGLNVEKGYGFPQIGTPTGSVSVPVYRSNLNTQSTVNGGLIPIRLFPSGGNSSNIRYASVCYVDSYVTRNGADITTRLIDTFGSNAFNIATIMILNNYTRGSWFGTTKTNMAITTWSPTNIIYGGVMNKLQFIGGAGGVVECYDSRSTTARQKCAFKEIGFSDYLDTNLSPPVDAEGRIITVHIAAIATGAGAPITRYTDNWRVFKRFGTRVIVVQPDMTSGDNDLSSFSPVILNPQNGLVRTQSAIQAATAVNTFREVAEELHNFAITSTGISSYAAPYEGNFFELEGRVLKTAFASVVLDPTAPAKIAYDQATNTLTLKSALISSGTAVSEWRNEGGTFSFLNGAQITGVFADADGSRANVSNLDPEGFGVTWFLRYKKTASATWTNVSGTGNNATILIDLDKYTFMARVPGYDWKTLEVDTNESLSIDMNLQYQVSANNTPQYTMVYNEDLEQAIQYDATRQAVAVTNTTGAIIQPGFAELYQATQRIQHIPALVWGWTLPVTANSTSQKIIIPDGNPISFFLTEDSTASVKVTCPVIHLTSGESADDRVRGNSDGYSIILGSPATAESAGLQSAIVSEILEKIGGAGYVIGIDSLKNIKDQVNAVKAVVDDLENYDDTTLTAKVDEVKGVVDLLENYDDTTLISKVDAIKSVADGIATAVADKTGYALTPAQIELIAVTVESHLLDEGDNQMLINAIVGAIGNTNVDQVALVAAIRSDLERNGGKISDIKAKVDTLNNTDLTTVAKEATLQQVKTKVDGLENADLSAVALEATSQSIITKVDNLNVDFQPVLDAVGSPLQAADYVAPDNTKIGQIKEKVDTLQNADLSAVALEASVQDVKEAVGNIEPVSLDGIATTEQLGVAKDLIIETVVSATGEQLENLL